MLCVALQRGLDVRALSQVLDTQRIREWVYLGEDSIWRVAAESAISSRAYRLNIADLLDEMSWRLRQPYIDWIGQLSLLNDSLEWWASELAAKTPYSRLYIRICLLAVGRELIARGFDRPTLIVCSSPALYDEVVCFASERGIEIQQLPTESWFPKLRSATELGRRYGQGAYRRMRRLTGHVFGTGQAALESELSYRRRLLAQRGIAPGGDFSGEDAILLFTWVDQRNFGPDGRYRDPHLGPLGEMLRAQGCRVAYVPTLLASAPFADVVDRLRQTGERLFFPELYVSDKERKDCYRRASKFRPLVPEELMVSHVPVQRLACENVEEKRMELARMLTYERMVANLSAVGVCPREIIHTFEGHSWEQVLAWSVRRHMPDTRVVGYDNVNFSRMALCLYPARCEYGLRPLPDRIVTNGPRFREILLAENIPPSLVTVGCGLRHAYLWDQPVARFQSDQNGQGRVTRVLVATAMSLGDAVELVTKALEAFAGDREYEVIVKYHPGMDGKLAMRYLGELAHSENILYVTDPIHELLPSADIILYTYSVVCYEALYYGVPPVFVKSESFLNLDQLDATPEVRWEARTPEDLRRVAGEIMGMSTVERRTWRKRSFEIVRAALAPITPESVAAFLI